jgi:hypothetical protein
MAQEDLLGAGLDIEGWSYLKGDVAQKISELTDRSLVLRSTFPMVIKSKVFNAGLPNGRFIYQNPHLGIGRGF